MPSTFMCCLLAMFAEVMHVTGSRMNGFVNLTVYASDEAKTGQSGIRVVR